MSSTENDDWAAESHRTARRRRSRPGRRLLGLVAVAYLIRRAYRRLIR